MYLRATSDRDRTSDLLIQLRLLVINRRKNLSLIQAIPFIRHAKQGKRPWNRNVGTILELTQDVRLGAVQRVGNQVIIQALRLVRLDPFAIYL